MKRTRVYLALDGERDYQDEMVASDARADMEKMLGSKVMLTTWVKVKTGWSNDDRALKSLGYDDV